MNDKYMQYKKGFKTAKDYLTKLYMTQEYIKLDTNQINALYTKEEWYDYGVQDGIEYYVHALKKHEFIVGDIYLTSDAEMNFKKRTEEYNNELHKKL